MIAVKASAFRSPLGARLFIIGIEIHIQLAHVLQAVIGFTVELQHVHFLFDQIDERQKRFALFHLESNTENKVCFYSWEGDTNLRCFSLLPDGSIFFEDVGGPYGQHGTLYRIQTSQ